MKFDTPATTNPIDQLKVIGQPLDRIDGPLKTTGRRPTPTSTTTAVPTWPMATWSVGDRQGPHHRHGHRCREAAPGVLAIVTAENAGPLDKGGCNTAKLLGGPEIEHYHQAIAVVVAETFEQARAAASLVQVDYAAAQGALRSRRRQQPRNSGEGSGAAPPEATVGDFAGAFARRRCKLDATYTTPDQSPCDDGAARLHRSLGGRQLVVWTSNQMIAWAVQRPGARRSASRRRRCA
jgi:xanthine dehydrogenase YagR molybdenum-binding subunit